MAIPAFQSNGELPAGEYSASLDEIEARFGQENSQRKTLMRGLRNASDNFIQSGVGTYGLMGVLSHRRLYLTILMDVGNTQMQLIRLFWMMFSLAIREKMLKRSMG